MFGVHEAVYLSIHQRVALLHSIPKFYQRIKRSYDARKPCRDSWRAYCTEYSVIKAWSVSVDSVGMMCYSVRACATSLRWTFTSMCVPKLAMALRVCLCAGLISFFLCDRTTGPSADMETYTNIACLGILIYYCVRDETRQYASILAYLDQLRTVVRRQRLL